METRAEGSAGRPAGGCVDTGTERLADRRAGAGAGRPADGHVDVTVVVPVYNVERYLDAALASIERNDRCSLEVLVVNDGSTDGSLAIMRAHEAKDARVRVIDKANQGYGATVNRGFAEARGTYVAIVEPDDWVEPHMYDELVEFARSFSPELGEDAPDVVKSPYWRIVGCGTGHERRLRCIYFGCVRPRRQPFTIDAAPRLVRHHPSIWSALYRRAFLERRGIRLMELPGAGWVDTPFGFEALCAAERIAYLEKPFYCYREDLPGSSSNRRIGAMSFERWGAMADVAERLGVTDRGVLEALYYVGLRYVNGARLEGSLDDADVAPALDAMCARMDPDIVAGMVDASPAARAFVLERAGRPVPRMSRVRYLASLVAEFGRSWRSNGAGYALGRIKLAFK